MTGEIQYAVVQISKLYLAVLVLLSGCDRYFMGRSTFVVDVLSMIQSSTYDGRRDRERERREERCLRLDLPGET